MLEPCRLNEMQGYERIIPPLNAASLEPLVRPAIKGDDTSKMKVIAASPLEIDLKMLTQQGAFTLHVMDEPLNQLQGCDEWLKKISIPAVYAPNIASELALLGINLADVFPDLYHLAQEIKNMHKPS